MQILILGNGRKPHVVECAERVRATLEQSGAKILGVELSGSEPVDADNADLAVVLGGDGAILRAVYQMGSAPAPVLGVNLGRLGFLAATGVDQFFSSCGDIAAGAFNVTSHLMLDCFLEGPAGQTHLRALNEVMISAGAPFIMTDVELAIDGEWVTTFTGDGLIVATPVGSTAHNLAAGGPILRQGMDGVVITPICPHALTWRPLVESAGREFKLRVANANEGTTLLVDGFNQIPIRSNQTIRIVRSRTAFRLVSLEGRGYYQTLTQKLHWGERPVS